eukprot:CAMPEP_0197837484 /NCGR_PEP_ID=MMETSP1437-20131217/32277_1 /TAXON_ID=49252 ORGANISM="Eucampia antarctica, Strain CCMP1452" /NCGR_SAMPLE_ID=MMETSP1437 /ASSEMBLY_ACC=CAM_ASM_001096 /LENGTH=136 /DNA_ID=CAMNT_0043444555 /DNA_START=118 /DNA_END=528 /DNA_ORIENTATION=-
MTPSSNICYKCGSTEHRLQICPKLTRTEKKSGGKLNYSQMDLPYATCYICNQGGHLASQCKQNKNGIYVNGGCCKECGGVDHLFLNCPKLIDDEDNEDDGSVVSIDKFLEGDIKDEDDTSSESKVTHKTKRKVVTF